jgi:hypothetical protein
MAAAWLNFLCSVRLTKVVDNVDASRKGARLAKEKTKFFAFFAGLA